MSVNNDSKARAHSAEQQRIAQENSTFAPAPDDSSAAKGAHSHQHKKGVAEFAGADQIAAGRDGYAAGVATGGSLTLDDADPTGAEASSGNTSRTARADVPIISPDADPTVASAQQQLHTDMNRPGISSTAVQKDVGALNDALKAAGRPDEFYAKLVDALPLNTSADNMAAVFAMAAKLGIDTDSGKDKITAAQTAAVKTREQREQYGRASQAQANQAQAPDFNQQKQNSGSTYDGQKAQPSTTTNDTSQAGGSAQQYSGPAANFPSDPAKWPSWDDAWQKAQSAMAGTANTPAQTAALKEAILDEASKTGLDPRYILAVVMQESGGDVHVKSTNNGVNNPGLMQSHNGASFSDNGDGGVASIKQMIKDGVEGTADGDGLIQGVQKYGDIFSAARYYNSGQVNASNLSDPQGATASYASDIANRLMGRM